MALKKVEPGRWRAYGSTSVPHWGSTCFQPWSWSFRHSFLATLRRIWLRVLRSGGAPVSERPESTKYMGSAYQLTKVARGQFLLEERMLQLVAKDQTRVQKGA